MTIFPRRKAIVAAADGGGGPSGVGGERGALMAPPTAYGAAVRASRDRDRNRASAMHVGGVRACGSVRMPYARQATCRASRSCGIGHGVVPGRGGADGSARNACCGRALSPARAPLASILISRCVFGARLVPYDV